MTRRNRSRWERVGNAKYFMPVAALLLCLSFPGFPAGKNLSLVLTSNLEGKFSLEEEGQDKNDPLLLVAQNILRERAAGRAEIYIDMGNAFYPGALSKYSLGSAMIDYFDYFKCSAMLVSSKDLRVGTDNLGFLAGNKKTALLSANIKRDDKPVFAPYFIHTMDGKKIAFIGLSSRKILFDIAEKNVYNIRLEDQKKALSDSLDAVRRAGAGQVVLLSGLTHAENMDLLGSFSDIGLVVCGGDNRGEFFGGYSARVDLADGRSIVSLSEGKGYYTLALSLDDRIIVREFSYHAVGPARTDDGNYREFVRRLALWKKKFKEEEDRVLANTTGREVILDDQRVASFLRDIFNTDVAILERDRLNTTTLKGDIRTSDLLNVVMYDYNIFSFYLSGAELRRVWNSRDGLLIDGYNGNNIQGYPSEEGRRYRVCSSQYVYERVRDVLSSSPSYTNSWKNITDLMLEDMKGNGALLKKDYHDLDGRFRITLDLYLSNYIENSSVTRRGNTASPAGLSESSYQLWGMENQADLKIFNRYHQFTITPYMQFVKQYLQGVELTDQDTYLKNLLRGTFLYVYNLDFAIKPYHKSQCETVVHSIDDQRPVIIRETVGSFITTDSLKLKLGVGFEKKVHDQVEQPAYGLEAIAAFSFGFWKYFTYSLTLDSFLSQAWSDPKKKYIRSDFANSLSFNFTRAVAVSLKRRWYYLYSMNYDRIGGVWQKEKYLDSLTCVSLDIRTDFRLH